MNSSAVESLPSIATTSGCKVLASRRYAVLISWLVAPIGIPRTSYREAHDAIRCWGGFDTVELVQVVFCADVYEQAVVAAAAIGGWIPTRSGGRVEVSKFEAEFQGQGNFRGGEHCTRRVVVVWRDSLWVDFSFCSVSFIRVDGFN